MKKKTRWKKILIWVASIIVILGVGGLFAANYVMDRMIAQLADSLENEIVADLGEIEPAVSPNGNEGQITDGIANNTDEDIDAGTEISKTIDENSVSNDGTEEYSGEVSAEQTKDLQEKITAGEKAKLASVFLKKLSVDDIKRIQQLASGGMNLEEKKEARTLILEKLTPEEYDELIVIAKKYGLSQGKSYAEVSKEK